MSEPMVLVLDQEERAAVAHELRRYGNYHADVGGDLWNVFARPEPDDLEFLEATPRIEEAADSHFAIAEVYDTLAARFDCSEPVALTRATIRLFEDALEVAYPGELAPEIARTAMFCRIAGRRLIQEGPDEAGEVIAVNAETQPPVPAGVATSELVYALEQVRRENARLQEQITGLTDRITVLGDQISAQQRQIEQLRDRGAKRRRLPNPLCFNATVRSWTPIVATSSGPLRFLSTSAPRPLLVRLRRRTAGSGP